MRKYTKSKSAPQNTIALIFDFDDTLTDDTIDGLLSKYDITAVQFWEDVDKLVRKGWSPPLAYMKKMVDLTKKKGPLSVLTVDDLRTFGKGLKFYQGIPKMFDELRELFKNEYERIDIEYYVISGGLQEVIEGSVIKSYLRDFWGSSFFFDETGKISFPKMAITFTEKTRCLFLINKGVVGRPYKKEPHDVVNEPLEEKSRRIPFSNMIYVGDGLTDIACISMLEKFGGITYGVFDPEKLKREEYVARPWLFLKRGVPALPARYGRDSRLRRELESGVLYICSRIYAKGSI